MNSTDTIQFKLTGFDYEKYKDLQKSEFEKRLEMVKNGHLYIEVGGKLVWDPHAQRVLPGFDPRGKADILLNLKQDFDIAFCMNFDDILNDRQLYSHEQKYIDASMDIVKKITGVFGKKPKIYINNIKEEMMSDQSFLRALDILSDDGLGTKYRYYIDGYPKDTKKILSIDGFGKDQYFSFENKLVLITGSASNSGKLSTCLGHIYTDIVNGTDSGYAKYETFPIWNLPLEHPLNLAYEAATVDIGDYNMFDPYSTNPSVNYNRDVEAFQIIKQLTEGFLPEENLIQTYKSPTDMGINMTGFAISNDEVCSIAAYREILRRQDWYPSKPECKEACEKLATRALRYIQEKGYNLNLQLEG